MAKRVDWLGKQRNLGNPRRKSLPVLPNLHNKDTTIAQLTPTYYQKTPSVENCKLPNIDMESSETAITPVQLELVRSSLLQYEDETMIDPGLEEAEGIAQSESFGRNYVDETVELTEISSLGIAKRLENLNLCGTKHVNLPSSHVTVGEKSDISPRKGGFKLQGSRATCQQRPAPRTSSTDRHLSTLQSNSTSSNKTKKISASRPNILTSMEERMVRNARSNAKNARSRRSMSAKTLVSKSLRPKTSVSRSRRNICLLTCIKPKNLEEEKRKFMKSGYTYNPQFEYEYPANPSVLERYNRASTEFLPQAMSIMKRVLERYENYEKFEWATGGQLLSKVQLWSMIRRYLEKEGFYGDVVVNISNDLIARAAMTINGGRPTLSIRETAAKKLWVEGLLRHEIGTHHLRFHNNRLQIWNSGKVRRQLAMKPANPTEEGLASLHSVLLRKDPSLWRPAVLYYTVYKASKMSFCELFEELGTFMDNPEVRWDYCLRTKRGQYDTSKPGCFCKDQVYLTGILQLLQVRHTLDFHLLCTMGKVSHEDIEMLKHHYKAEHTKIPGFMKDLPAYRRRLDHIVTVNGLDEWTDNVAPEERENCNNVEESGAVTVRNC
ncbi:microtubule-associated tyrosine carboxypeptidase 1-like [Clavelina lepadiformis]|uniref:microtubule-associated tyrosine carboxypeptidase 1-like n=1 Tax=Clavelina lepadiformis TaxID=159417 RepID=UPI00404157C0